MPLSVGYEQNPLSVYYCYDEQGGVAQCIAEVLVFLYFCVWLSVLFQVLKHELLTMLNMSCPYPYPYEDMNW